MDERAANACALLHATRKLPRKFTLVSAQTYGLQKFDGACFKLLLACFELRAEGFDNFKRQQDVVECGAPRQKRWRLKRHATDLERPGDGLVVYKNFTTAGFFQTRGEFHKSGLAAT